MVERGEEMEGREIEREQEGEGALLFKQGLTDAVASEGEANRGAIVLGLSLTLFL